MNSKGALGPLSQAESIGLPCAHGVLLTQARMQAWAASKPQWASKDHYPEARGHLLRRAADTTQR